MRVLIWTEFFWPSIGGNEVWSAHLVRALRSRGHELTVVSGRLGEEIRAIDDFEGVPVHRIPFRAAFASRDLGRLGRIRSDLVELCDSFVPDLVHMTWLGPCALFHHQLQVLRPRPTLITLGQHVRGDTGRSSLLGRTLRTATWIAACTGWMHESLLARVPEVADRSSIVHHALPGAGEAPPYEGAPRLLCLGRLVPSKGFDIALRAFPAIVSRHPSARLVIAGDGPERAALQNLAASLGVDRAVSFAGFVPPEKTAEMLASSTLVMMPSREETFGLVALETAWVGRPIVATRVEGLGEVVGEGDAGVLVPAGDHEALSRAVVALLDDPHRRDAIGRRARERVAAQFSWTAHVETYEDLYARLLAGRHRRVRADRGGPE